MELNHTSFVMLLLLGAIILFAPIATSLLDDLPNELTSRQSITSCICNAGDIYFSHNEIVTVSLATRSFNKTIKTAVVLDRILLGSLYQKMKWSILVKKPAKQTYRGLLTSIEYKKSHNYIIQIRDYYEMADDLEHLKNHPSWNPHAKFMIISVSSFDNVRLVVSSVIEVLWKYDVLNGVLIFPTIENNSIFNVFTWYPYSKGRCGNVFNEIKIIATCNFGNILSETNWFPVKIPNNLNGCPIDVLTLLYPPFVMKRKTCLTGLDIELMNLIAETANFTIKYNVSEKLNTWGGVKRNGSGILGMLLHSEADLGIGSMSASADRHSALDSTSAYFFDSLGFCVPHADEVDQWKKLIGIMSGRVWLGVIGIALFIIFMMRTFAVRYPNERAVYKSAVPVLQRTIAVFFGNAINLQPLCTKVRLIFMLWILFSLQVNTAYQTYLMSSLTNPEYEQQIRSIKDILDSKLDMLFLDGAKRYFFSNKHNPNPMLDEIMRRWITCNDLDECFYRTANKRDSVVTTSRLYSSYAIGGYKSQNGRPLLYCFGHNIVTYPIVIYMRKGFPLRNRVDDIISNINAGGFVQWWERNLFVQKKRTTLRAANSADERLIGLAHLHPVFIVLSVGMLLALAVFCCELVFFNLHKNDEMNGSAKMGWDGKLIY